MRPTATNTLVTLNILGIIEGTTFQTRNPMGLFIPVHARLVNFVHTSFEIALQVHTPPLLVTMAVYEG